MGQDSRNDGKKVNKVEMEIDSLEVAVGAAAVSTFVERRKRRNYLKE